MRKQFKVGDRVAWNSEAGRVRGRIVRVHSRKVTYKGYTRHASKEEPHTRSRARRPITLRCIREPR